MNYNLDVPEYNVQIPKRTSFNNVNIKNNKCFTFPYNYLLVTNNIGNQNIFKYEMFSTQNCVFKINNVITIGGSGKLVPLNYKGQAIADDEGLSVGKFPVCSWSSDAFTNWLTQNSINLASNFALGLVGQAPNVDTNISAMRKEKTLDKTMGAFNVATNIAGEIANQIGQFYSASIAPNIEGGTNNADVVWASNRNIFVFKEMRIKDEFLQIIDNFFSMYGYKVNATKTPNITGRRNWNYVKTTDINLIGNIPQEDLQEIKNMFNNGVTFWHNVNTFLDYTQNNDII